MKKLLIAALAGAQVIMPAAAADLDAARGAEASRTGAFAGVRLRVSLDPQPRERVRAGLAVSPTTHSLRGDGSARMRIGEGLEFGLGESRSAELSLAGRPVSEIGPEAERSNVSTVGWVAIGVGVAAVAVVVWFLDAMADSSK